jgi:CheY-like chemotaxis protein
MRLEFRLLIVDDDPSSIGQGLEIFRDYLRKQGFSLQEVVAADLSPNGIRKLARKTGRDYDLVIIDFNLGRGDTNGSDAAAKFRKELQYTDIIFYSSDPNIDLWSKLAESKVAGVFIADRTRIDESLVGVTETIIGKAIDLTHMRGIAMAEVAEMDVMMEETLRFVIESKVTGARELGAKILKKLKESGEQNLKRLEGLIDKNDVTSIVGDSRIFSSTHKFLAVKRAVNLLAAKPAALKVLEAYEKDIIANRNTLAHAMDQAGDNGNTVLRSAKYGEDPVVIDDNWMNDFRSKLRIHRGALNEVCGALKEHSALKDAQQDQAELLSK